MARLAGAALIAAGWGSSLWLRALMPGRPEQPTPLECTLVVASFVLTLGGALLVLNGKRLCGRS
ncbi:hypothetical protein [Sphingomonas sp.]|uniref:hypothetical protein n=1 Tax=Sphingomonas sp. TaxID=28214 RepID=UPI003B3A89FE